MATSTAETIGPDRGITIDSLKERSADELEMLYRELTPSTGLKDLNGKPKGEVLAVTGLDWKPVSNVIRLFGDSPIFPWLGKGFAPKSDKNGEGNNRLNLLGYKPEWFDFETRIEASEIDGRNAVLLDYDLDGNPLPIRHIRDELREAAPGVWFGPAMARIGDDHYTVLWFAVDFNQ